MPDTEPLDVEVQTEQETPVEETPSVENGPDESPETPATTASDKTPEGTPHKTPEQIKDDAAFFQTKYQSAKAELDTLRGEFVDEPEDAPHAQDTPAQKPLTDEELGQLVAENPILAMQFMTQEFSRVVDERLSDRDKKAQARRDFERENDRANLALAKYYRENNVTKEEYGAAKKELDALGVRARPSGYTDLLIDRIEINRFKAHGAKKVQEAAAKAAQAAKTQVLTTQPGGGEVSQPAAKTHQDVIAEKFAPSKQSKKFEGFFGG